MSLLDVITIILKRKYQVMCILIAICASVTSCTMLQVPVYEARSDILIKMFDDETSRPGMETEDPRLARLITPDQIINTEIQVLSGRGLAEKVIRNISIKKIYPDLISSDIAENDAMDGAVQAFLTDLKVTGVKKTNVISVTYQHPDPVIAASATNLLVEAFKDKHLALHSDPQSDFTTRQLAAFSRKLKESEKKLQEYQLSKGVFSLEEQQSLLLKQRMELDSALKSTINNIAETKKKEASIKQQMRNNTATGGYTRTERDQIIIGAKAKQLELQLREHELLNKYNVDSKLVKDVRNELKIVKDFLKEQEEGIAGTVKTANPVYQNMEIELFKAETELQAQVAKADSLRQQLTVLQGQIADLDMNEIKIQDLKRQQTIDEKNYKTYADRHEVARISDEMNRLRLSNIAVIQPANIPTKPVKPDKKTNVLLGCLLGMVAGVTYALLVETLNPTFSDPKSVEKHLELPVLLTVQKKGR